MNERQEKREIYVRQRAYELAQSGAHLNYQTIEFAIREEGYPEARRLLDSRELREQLDLLCQRAKSAHA